MNKIRKDAPVILTMDNQHMVMLPDGSLLPGVTKTIVTDEFNEPARATIEVLVNIATDEVQAQEIIRSYKES